MRAAGLGVLAALALAGCAGGTGGGGDAPLGTSEREARVLAAVSGVRAVLGGLSSRDGVGLPRAVPGGFSPEAIAAEPSAYRLVQVNALGLAEPARVIQENGPEVTVALRSGPTAAFDNGVLTATRGFGDDLMTVDAPGLLGRLRAGGGQLTRTMEMLGPQDQIVTETFACTVTAAGTETVDLAVRRAELRRLDENCRGEALIFDNIYWLDGGGAIVASRQYVSPTVAYLRSNRL